MEFATSPSHITFASHCRFLDSPQPSKTRAKANDAKKVGSKKGEAAKNGEAKGKDTKTSQSLNDTGQPCHEPDPEGLLESMAHHNHTVLFCPSACISMDLLKIYQVVNGAVLLWNIP